MEKRFLQGSSGLVILIFLALFLFTFRLGTDSLWDADEAIYGQVAREILVFRDWITLHYNYQKWFEKPPLYFWLTALNIRLFGLHEFSVRFWSAIFGLGGVISTYFLGRELFNHRTGLGAGIILTTNFLYLGMSRLALLDTGLTFFLVFSFLFAVKSVQKPVYYLPFFAALGMAVLIKGPVAVVIAGLILVPFFIRRGKLSFSYFWLGVGVFLVLSMPWYLANLLINRVDFLQVFLGFHHLARFFSPIQTHGEPIYYYLIVIILGFLPWSVFLPAALINLWSGRKSLAINFLLIGGIAVLIFFSFSRTKLPGYILPLFPVLSLVTAHYWEGLLTGRYNTSFIRTRLAFIFLPIICMVLIGVIGFFARQYLPLQFSSSLPEFILGAGILIIGCLLATLFSIKSKFLVSFPCIVITVVFFFLIVQFQLLPRLEDYKFARPLARELSQYWSPGDQVASTQFSDGLVFYGNYPIDFIDFISEDLLEYYVRAKRPAYLIISRSQFQRITREEVSLFIIASHQDVVLASNKRLN